MKKAVAIKLLLIISAIMGGLLAGGDLYRYLIEVPAWRNLEISEWVSYSKHADLGNGYFLFPVEAFGGAIPLVFASVICLKNGNLNPIASFLYVSTIFAIAGLILTAFAAPIMLHLPKIEGDTLLMQRAFNRFHFWGILRGVAQILSFCFCVLVLSNLCQLSILQKQ